MDFKIYCSVLVLAITLLARTESAEYKLIWADEFNGTEVNENDWRFEMNCSGNSFKNKFNFKS